MLCKWLESEADTELCSLSELHHKMIEFLSLLRQKNKAKTPGEFIYFAEFEGNGNVFFFRNMAKYIINEEWYTDKKADIEDEAECIVIAALKMKSELENVILNPIQQLWILKVVDGYHITYQCC